MTRLNKFIAESGLTSRRKAEEFILQGRVTVNNKTIRSLSFVVNSETDLVKVDGEKIKPAKKVYYLLNKPSGYISSTVDEKNRNTVLDLVTTHENIFPVGRLDYDTTGVLLLTNDGDFSNLLLHPRNNVPRIYEVKLDKPLQLDDITKLKKGINIDGKKGVFEKISFNKINDKAKATVECFEGRNRFVKKMFEQLGYKVLTLNRFSFANIQADIPIGKFRKLSKAEVEGIIKLYA